MKRFALFSIAALGLCAAPAAAQVPPPPSYHYVLPENAIRFRLGLFMPQAEGDYFDSVFTDFTGSSDDFEDWTFGIDYTHSLVPMLDIIAGGSYYESSQSQEYRDFVDSDGLPIVHDTSLQISNFDVGLRVKLAPEHLPVVPYVGGGGSLVTYRLIEHGDFISFNPPAPTIFFDHFEAEGVGFGYFLLAGLDINFNQYFGMFVEGRWRDAKDDLADDFSDFGEIDLSGTEVTGGLIWRF